jgi:hypothetical protein
MNILDKITDAEYAQIDAWRRAYVEGHHSRSFCSSRELLSLEYATSKQTLFKMFGENNLILSQPISLQKSEADLIYAFNCHKNDCAYIKFYQLLCAHINSSCHWRRQYEIINTLFDSRSLCRNKWEKIFTVFPIGKEEEEGIKIHSGMKITSILKKLAKAWGFEKEFEEFRIWHSQILNDKILSGTLHLSIHPLDYMTMSDNTYNWSSCMSWKEDGCYRQGTVEMMNSPCVVMAYLTGEKNDFLINGTPWSNKKWRSLYVVSPDCIASIKNYPYQNEELDKFVLDWIKTLAENNLGWRYDTFERCSEDCIIFETEYMYNDFDALDHHLMYINNSHQCHINYSGKSQCMYCGEVDIYLEDESLLQCEQCNSNCYCEMCNEYMGGDHHSIIDEWGNAIYICSDCHEQSPVSFCNECGWETIGPLTSIYLLDEETSNIASRAYCMCQQCLKYSFIPISTDLNNRRYSSNPSLFRRYGIKNLDCPIKLNF